MSGESSPTVLIVDDEPPLVELYSSWLERTYTVRTATSGQRALDQTDEDIDIVLLDRKMPDLTGNEVLDKIREQDVDCRVVMVTAVEPDTDIIEMEFDDYLIKPVNKDELRNVIESMLSRLNYDEQLQEYFALISKQATLQAGTEFEESEEKYSELQNRLAELKNQIDDQLSNFTEHDYGTVFSRFSRDKNSQSDSSDVHSAQRDGA